MRIRRSLLGAGVLLAAVSAGRADTVAYAYTGSIATYNVQTTGAYDITAISAAGGAGQRSAAGSGALIEGTFNLTAGDILKIVVGQAGGDGLSGGGGGGGGTFVVIDGGSPLLIAGGGGGGGFDGGNVGQNAADLSVQTSGGGSGGAGGGHVGDDNGAGAGGGGLTANGAIGYDPIFTQPDGGQSFQNGGAGGAGSNNFGLGNVGGDGGFGGGGGGSDVGAGGGGGYAGGNGGDAYPPEGGGAGYSYYNPGLGSLDHFSSSTFADGSVTIAAPAAVVPVPASAEAGGLLLAGLFLAKYRRRLAQNS